jgi:hypothetical protein
MRKLNDVSFLALVTIGLVGWSSPAFAYRPFDSTDPSVADPGEFEIEFSPISFSWDDSHETWIAPQLKFNYGFAPKWELVVEGEAEHPRSSGSSSTLVGNAAFLKTVVHEGSLQGKSGPSVATEFGVLLPGINDEAGFGLEWAGIVGHEATWGAIHFNFAAALTRDERAEIFLGTIIEGPSDWVIRPVAELVYEREFHTTEIFAALAGIIWEARDDLAFDFALRQASVNGEPETQLRIGLTYAFSVR